MDLIGIVLLFLIGLLISAFIRSYFREKERVQRETINYLNSVIHKVLIEKHHGLEYWFDEDDNTFLAQGKNFEEVTGILKGRFPGHVFLVEAGGISEKTNWKLIPFDNRDIGSFVGKLIYGKNQ
jgi:hypothetical protein